jgi:phosphoglycolate phosphatase-like HAD superfamily hydrolase
MDLVLFDVDGTLIRSMQDDGECLVASLYEVFGFTDVEEDWSCYQHITDIGILIEAFEQRSGRPPSEAEIATFCEHFVGLITERCSEKPMEPIAGAALLLESLGEREDIAIAFATGSFRRSAAVKMQSARLSFDQAPAATCNDAISRHEIMEIGIAKAAADQGVPRFENVVYVGDGVWDVWACRRLGLPFIGVAADITAERLRAEGIEFLLPDLRDQRLFHDYRERSGMRGN